MDKEQKISEGAPKTLYFSMLHCHLVYGLNVWGSETKTNLKPLVTKQKQAIRLITNNAHTEPLFKKCNMLPVEQLIDFLQKIILFITTLMTIFPVHLRTHGQQTVKEEQKGIRQT